MLAVGVELGQAADGAFFGLDVGLVWGGCFADELDEGLFGWVADGLVDSVAVGHGIFKNYLNYIRFIK